MQLSAEQAKDLDDAAADAWNRSAEPFRCVKARQLFKKDPRVVGFDAATIILLVRIGWEIWKWWKANGISNTPYVTLANAPSFRGAE